MTGFPATWNAAAPKLVFDGLHQYAVLCGAAGSPHLCTVARRRGEEAWIVSARVFRSDQPAVAVLDRKGRLNVFYNDPVPHHIRFDRPAVDLANPTVLPLGVGVPVAYLHASYDASADTIMLAGNETTSWTLYISTKTGDAGWTPAAAMPGPHSRDAMYLYARTLMTRGRYYVLAGEHQRATPNASYTAALLFESPTPTGPRSARELHRATGRNLGIPYENWVLPIDLQADPSGRVRALLHIFESGSGHPGRPDGLHLAREEDGFGTRYVGAGVDDGFVLHIDPSGVHLAFALILSNPIYPEAGFLAVFRSDDGGVSWQTQRRLVNEGALNPVSIEHRNGSLPAVSEVPFIYSAPLHTPFARVSSHSWPLNLPPTTNRFASTTLNSSGERVDTRFYYDATVVRGYRHQQVTKPDGSFVINYEYAAGTYRHVYAADSRGAYSFRSSDGDQVSYHPPD